MNNKSNLALRLWIAAGLLAYIALPWYAIQDANGLSRIGQVFSGEVWRFRFSIGVGERFHRVQSS